MTIIDDAYRRFCDRRFPLSNETQVAALERRINVSLPDDYRRYLLEFNGGFFDDPEIGTAVEGTPQTALCAMYGIGALHGSAELATPPDLVLFDDNDPPKILPIGLTPMGDLIILDTAPGDGRGEIYLKQAFGNFYWLAENIEDFFGLLRP